MSTVRVRFAPSPTGDLHVGGARTALFNWLFARGERGVFVLRIEDTDQLRSTEEATTVILDSLTYLGLTWDEGPLKGGAHGPYRQSERLGIYHEYVGKLLASGRAYKCYCSPEELDQRRQEQIRKGEASRYDGRCRDLTSEEQAAYEAAGRKPVVRFRALAEGKTEIMDLIRGKVSFANTQIDDFVLMKSDGMPTYNFAVVIDDALMQITHVIRGEDHLSNTPKQVQIYEALGFGLPQFAHIPMILGSDKALLSKRHGATSVLQFEEDGYLPGAMVNYLALLGWGYDDAQTIFSRDDLVRKFSLERVSRNPAVFDLQKLEWMNGVYIRGLSPEELYAAVLPRWQRAGFLPAEVSPEQKEFAISILQELSSRIKLLSESEQQAQYFFNDDYGYNQAAVAKTLATEKAEQILRYLGDGLKELPALDEEHAKPLFAAGMEQFGVKMGGMIQPLRVAVTGTNISPGIYEVLELLGPERVLSRIERTLQMLEKRRETDGSQS